MLGDFLMLIQKNCTERYGTVVISNYYVGKSTYIVVPW